MLVGVYVAATASSTHDSTNISSHPSFVSDEQLMQFSASVITGQLLASGWLLCVEYGWSSVLSSEDVLIILHKIAEE